MKAENKIILKQKLKSRKLWMAVIGFLTAIISAFFCGDIDSDRISLIVSGCASLCAYIVGEGIVDAARIKKSK